MAIVMIVLALISTASLGFAAVIFQASIQKGAIYGVIGLLTTITFVFLLGMPLLPYELALWTTVLVAGISVGAMAIGGSSDPHYGSAKSTAIIAGASYVGCLMISLWSSPVFQADKYRDQLVITKKVYELPELTQSAKIPVDIELAKDLMKKAIPPELSSRFEAGEITRQADSRGNIMYVAPMEHTGVIAAFFNGSTPGYVAMDAADASSVKAVLTDKAGKPLQLSYSMSAVGMQDINTYIHLKKPSALINSTKFYLDDEGNPYWVALTQKRTIGVKGYDTDGVIVVNAKTGELKEYSLNDKIPSWIDRLYDTEMLEEQVDNHYRYVHGFFNTSKLEVRELIGKADYVQLGDQTYMYMTIGNQNNNTMTTGAVLVNTRTKEASYYERKVFAETEVVSAAEQAYREKGYNAGNPLLRTIEGNMVFVVQMHGAASTVAGYVVRSAYPQGPISSGSTLAEAYQNYVQKMMETPSLSMAKQAVANTLEGAISQKGAEIVNGNTVYSLRVVGHKDIFVIARTVSPELPLLEKGQVVALEYRKGVNGVNNVYALKVKE
jgi:hypothetical protein